MRSARSEEHTSELQSPSPYTTLFRSDPLVCYAGNLDGYQNLRFLLDAFARVRAAEPAARLVLVTHADAQANAARLVAGTPAPGVEIVQTTSYDEVREIGRAHV